MDDYIAYKRTSRQWNMGHFHFHEQYEVLLSLSENAKMFVTDRCYPLQNGSLILLPSAVLHRSVASAEQQYNRYVIRFSRQYAESLSTNTTNLLRCFQRGRIHYQLTAEQTRRLSRFYDACLEERTGFGSDLRHTMAFVNLLLAVDEITSAPAEPVAEALPHNAASEILSYIQSHLTEDLSLDALAARFFVSKSHLCRLFKDFTGFPPGEYIIKTRIMRARMLLREGKSVQEAGEAAGFKNYAHFIRTFRQIVGMSPGKYRSQN